MRAHVIEGDKIVNTIEVQSLNVLPELRLVDASAGGRVGDGWQDGAPVPSVPAPPTVPEYVAAVQAMLDTKAQERNYDGILSACTYATSANAKFRGEGQACVNWRDAVWARCYDLLAQVGAGTLPQPSVAGLLAMLPILVWPT